MSKQTLSDEGIIRLLKIIMTIGLCFIALGVYFHMFNQTIEEMGVTGILISAILVALGMIMSLPTKMFITFMLVKREQESDKAHKLEKTHKSDAS